MFVSQNMATFENSIQNQSGTEGELNIMCSVKPAQQHTIALRHYIEAYTPQVQKKHMFLMQSQRYIKKASSKFFQSDFADGR